MYKVKFNCSGEVSTISLPDEKIDGLLQAVNKKSVVAIEGNYYNTAYFIEAIKDVSEIKLDKEKSQRLEDTKKLYIT